jgi:hypothetical protein
MGGVLTQVVDELQAPRFAAPLLPATLIAELAPRARFGLGAGNAAGDQVLGASVEMKLPLLDHVAFHAALEHESRKERS